jgi:hypothetical protein
MKYKLLGFKKDKGVCGEIFGSSVSDAAPSIKDIVNKN